MRKTEGKKKKIMGSTIPLPGMYSKEMSPYV